MQLTKNYTYNGKRLAVKSYILVNKKIIRSAEKVSWADQALCWPSSGLKRAGGQKPSPSPAARPA